MKWSKKRFSASERWAVYSVHGDKCYLNGEPLTLLTMEIDHIIPESLLADQNRLQSVLREYGLANDFDLNSYENWLPSCSACNRTKRDAVFECTLIVQSHLVRAKHKAEQARAFERKSLSDKQTARLLNDIDRAFNVSPLDILTSSFARLLADTSQLPQEKMILPSGRFSWVFDANTTGHKASKESFFGDEGETHAVTMFSSLGRFKLVFREGEEVKLSFSTDARLSVDFGQLKFCSTELDFVDGPPFGPNALMIELSPSPQIPQADDDNKD